MHQPVAHAVRTPLASLPGRLLAQILDGLVAGVIVVAAVLLSPLSESMSSTLAIAGVVAGVGYYLFADCLGEGQSYGKRWLGMAVVHSETGAPCTPAQSLVRNLLLSLLGPIDWIFIFGSRRQRLGDMLARTLVIEAPRRTA